MSERFGELIAWASSHYDLVLIDTPPICGDRCGDCWPSCRHHADGGALCGQHAERGGNQLSRFEQNGIQVKRVILNSIFRRASGYQDYGYYEYEYTSDAK